MIAPRYGTNEDMIELVAEAGRRGIRVLLDLVAGHTSIEHSWFQLGAALTFLFTWGSIPCLYYGDEIGMRYLSGAPAVEGAICNPKYNRAGCGTVPPH